MNICTRVVPRIFIPTLVPRIFIPTLVPRIFISYPGYLSRTPDIYLAPDIQVIDTPPGTSDEHLSLAQYLKTCRVDGVVIVTTPQEISLLDVRKGNLPSGTRIVGSES